jgi:UDP-glucose:(heptosyl)LPS alpha-1,3-glucosyltransferase
MNIALSFPGCFRRGGVERVMLECARFLAGAGHQVDVFANEWDLGPNPDESSRRIRFVHVPMMRRPWFLRGPSYFRACTKALSSRRYDVLNTHGCVCPTGGVQWVQSVHRAWLERAAAFRRPFSAKWFRQKLNVEHRVLLDMEEQHFGKRRYRKIIATTPDVKNDLHRLYGVPLDDVAVVPNGFAPEEFNPARRAARRDQMRQQLGLAPDHVALLFVGNELDRKGFDTIAGAMALLRRPELRLLAVGRPKAVEVLARAGRFGVADQVVACGPTGDIAAYHAAADLFVLPTQYEAFCLAILEALGSGLPVITSTVPGARDAIVPGVNGSLVESPQSAAELAAAIEPLLDSNRREALTSTVAPSVAHYQWPAVLQRYESLLTEYRN